MTPLQQFLESTHFALVAITVACGGEITEAYLNHLAAAQDDLDRCTLVNRMRERIAEHGFNPKFGVYHDLLREVA